MESYCLKRNGEAMNQIGKQITNWWKMFQYICNSLGVNLFNVLVQYVSIKKCLTIEKWAKSLNRKKIFFQMRFKWQVII